MVATGGGPGAMEAANLGAFLSEAAGRWSSGGPWPNSPRCRPSAPRCLPGHARPPPSSNAFPDGTPSLGIPTWFYGHEPPNFFATHVAKYFANAVREAILLELCNGGIVFLPGPAAPCRRSSRTPARTTTAPRKP